MTRDEVIEIWGKANGWSIKEFNITITELEHFAQLIAEREREACAAMAEAEKQEPVAWNTGVPPMWPQQKGGETFIVSYEDPQPKREWVGLTDDDMLGALISVDPETKRLPIGFVRFAEVIEAKLKEKNT
jgi:hypothetical protein